MQLMQDIADFFRHAPPQKEHLVRLYGKQGLLVAQDQSLLFWTEAGPKKFAIQETRIPLPMEALP